MTKPHRQLNTLEFLAGMQAPLVEGGGEPLDLDLIDFDPKQPRSQFRPVDGVVDPEVLEKLEQLADDIYERTLLQPIVVRPVGDRYVIVAGERRYRAFKLNRERGRPNSAEIPAIIRNDLTASQLRLSQLSENLQRDDLTDLETATYIRDLLQDYPELKKKDVGQLVKKNSQYVSRLLALLDPQWKDVVDSGAIQYASLLEQYRPLPREQQEELKDLAKRENRSLTSGDIRAAKARADAAQTFGNTRTEAPGASAAQGAGVAGGAGAAGINSELAKAVDDFLASSTPKGENYTPPASTPAQRNSKPQIKDAGGDAVIPPGTAALNPALNEKRETKLTLQQLEKLLSRGALANKGHQASIMLPVNELKAAIVSVGGSVPDDESQLVMRLLESINQL